MEMSWMETVRLLGLDVLAGMILALLILELVDHAVHSAIDATRVRWRQGGRAAPVRGPSRIGAPRHV